MTKKSIMLSLAIALSTLLSSDASASAISAAAKAAYNDTALELIGKGITLFPILSEARNADERWLSICQNMATNGNKDPAYDWDSLQLILTTGIDSEWGLSHNVKMHAPEHLRGTYAGKIKMTTGSFHFYAVLNRASEESGSGPAYASLPNLYLELDGIVNKHSDQEFRYSNTPKKACTQFGKGFDFSGSDDIAHLRALQAASDAIFTAITSK